MCENTQIVWFVGTGLFNKNRKQINIYAKPTRKQTEADVFVTF